MIGDLSIMDIDRRNRKAGFRIALHSPAYLNKGYGIEAVRLAMQLAFERLDLNPSSSKSFTQYPRAESI
ncbi:GNAT family N-acetyltransferase [Bacillus licheniformis]|nr:GNAT family N-acetyltransferase [Bacillus licheniformis]